MRILLPIDRVADAGIGTVTRDLCRMLPKVLDDGDRLVTVGGRSPCSTDANVSHVMTRRPPVNRMARFFHEQAVLARAAQTADLVHMTDHRAVLASERPFLVTIHDLTFIERRDWYPSSVRAFKTVMLRAALAKRPRAIVCVSEHTRDQLRKHHPELDPGRLHVVHPGIEPEDAPREGDGSGDFFLTVATIEPRKNHLTLLRAFEQARARGLELRWKVVGAPGYSSPRILRELERTPGVELTGLVSDGERERLYRQAAFVALPSHAEGFGFPPLEAMARGVPAICSTGSALDETAGDGALRVPSDDVAAWADALCQLAEDAGMRSELRDRGLQRIRTFDPLRSARSYAEIYRTATA
jgi:glycosyltransferase involved in cell wall biosynthesis